MPQNPPIRSYSWAEMDEFAGSLSEKVRELEVQPTAIVAILRGGAFPGLLLSHALGLRKLYTLTVRSTVDETTRAQRHANLSAEGMGGLPDLSSEDVIVVDDVTNTGRTLAAAVDALQATRHPRSIRTGCLVWDTVPDEGSIVLSECTADLWVDTVHAWAHFPWESSPRSRDAEGNGQMRMDSTGTTGARME